jgi:hypothetical protein
MITAAHQLTYDDHQIWCSLENPNLWAVSILAEARDYTKMFERAAYVGAVREGRLIRIAPPDSFLIAGRD